ncbi:MAG: DUF1311 domain-containing protein [Deltaproteobacteria bacterium]|nr:DUF1311 domain-containing protein [Deltaproteobacteria bacterium]
MKRWLTAIGICLLIGSWANAKEPYSPEYSKCLEHADGNDFNSRDCNSSEFEIQDGLLNQKYQKLLKAVEEGGYGDEQTDTRLKKDIRAAQRLWVQFRDKNCEVHYLAAGGGTYSAVAGTYCMLEMTVQRAKELKDLLPSE